MEKFFRWLLSNRLLVHYITVVIIILGFLSFSKAQREARPNVNFNRVAITAVYPGASPNDIEELVIDPIEEKIAEVDGVEEYRSVSFNGAGSISVKVDDEYPDPEEVIDDLRRKISEVKDLPKEVDDPVVTEIKASNIPVMRLALYGDVSPYNLKLEVEKLKDLLQTVQGVQSVENAGLEDLQLKVLTDSKSLDRYDITLIELISSLTEWSRQKPGGLFENSSETSNVNIGLDYNNLEKLENFILRSNDSGRFVQLKDIANISYDLENIQRETIFESQSAVIITVIKKPFADIIKTVDSIKEAIDGYKLGIPKNLNVKMYTDESERVRDRLNIVVTNAIFGLFLVILILVMFLDWRSAVVSSLGIPIAILGGLTLVFYLGNTLNSLVIVGLIVVLGMLVDDAIVVCENIYSYIEEGMDSHEAAIKGTSEIAVPVLATVLTTVFAFFPILFMKEIIGQFLRVIPLTVIAMLLVSLFEALVILPTHAAEIMKPKKKNENSFFNRLEKKYAVYLRWSLKFRWAILIGFVCFFMVSIFQGKSLFEKFSLFPATGLDGLSIRVELGKNVPISKTTETVKRMSRELAKISKNNFESMYSTVGEVTTGGAGGSRQSGSHLANIGIVFISDQSFYKKEKELVQNIRKLAKEFAAKENIKATITLDRPGPPIGKPIQFEVASRDISKGLQLVDKLKNELSQMKGVNSLETDLDGDTKKYRFLIDNNLAVAEGVSPSLLAQTIFAATTGRVASEILQNNEKIEILVGLKKDSMTEIKDILNLKVRNTTRQAVPISTFVRAIEEKGPASIQRLNGLRTITLFGEVDEDITSGREVNMAIAPEIEKLKKEFPGISINTGGGEKDRMNALLDTRRLYILALFLIFVVISLAFQSLIYPVFVLLAIPMGICGVVWSLTLHGQPLSLMGIVGVVGLSGVVVNISILILSFVQDKIKQGLAFEDAIVEAGVKRLRPIVITTTTTLIGLVPTIYGIGGVDFFVQPLALVLGWGLFVATIMTLIGLPALVSFCTVLDKK